MNTNINMNLSISLWESELVRAYDHIVWSYSLKLYRPRIQIVDVSSFWGQWNPIERKIQIAKRLIDNYTWDVVINILKHEMAHQIDSDQFSGTGGHGEGFKRACQLLRVPFEYQNSALDAGEKIFNWRENTTESKSDDDQNENHAMIRKVEKLLSLAQSANENEALVAMEKVMHIYQSYNIKRIESHIKSNYVCSIINLRKQKIESYQSSICTVIQEFYFTDVVFSWLYDAKVCKKHHVFEFYGTKENVQMAEYVYFFLNNKVLDLWKEYSQKNKLSVKFKRSYLLGVLRGFRQKLQNMKKLSHSVMATNNALTIAEKDPDLKLFVQNKYPRLTTGKSSGTGVYMDAFESGKQDGKSIVINKGIDSRGKSTQDLFLN